MRQRIILNSDVRKPKRFPDGKLLILPIDQFPVKDCNISKFGFPKSDITIFDEMQKTATTDFSVYGAFAQRLTAIAAEKPNGIKIFDDDGHVIKQNLSDLMINYRPSWMQTQAEERQFVDWMVEQHGAVIAKELGLFKDEDFEESAPALVSDPDPKPE